MLSRNDQLVPEGQGRRQKARGTCYVDEPPFGFFIAGSTVKVLNGVYIRRNIPRALRENQRTLLFYESAFFFSLRSHAPLPALSKGFHAAHPRPSNHPRSPLTPSNRLREQGHNAAVGGHCGRDGGDEVLWHQGTSVLVHCG